jgi:hypothetical protein
MTPQPKEADEMKALVEPDDASWLHCLARGTLANTVLIAEPKVRKRIARIAEALTRTPPSASIEVTEEMIEAGVAEMGGRGRNSGEAVTAIYLAMSRARQKDQG